MRIVNGERWRSTRDTKPGTRRKHCDGTARRNGEMERAGLGHVMLLLKYANMDASPAQFPPPRSTLSAYLAGPPDGAERDC
jgi:hypothetical protein